MTTHTPTPWIVMETRERVQWLKDMFEFEYCAECGGDWDAHDCVPNAVGLPHARCKPRTLDVLFRKYRGEITAVFPSEPWSSEYDMTCYAHVGQHGSCNRGWYNKTRKAKPAEYADLLAELRGIYAPEYELRVMARMQQRHTKQRRAEMQRMRESA